MITGSDCIPHTFRQTEGIYYEDTPYFLPKFRGIAYSVAELNAALNLVTRARK